MIEAHAEVLAFLRKELGDLDEIVELCNGPLLASLAYTYATAGELGVKTVLQMLVTVAYHAGLKAGSRGNQEEGNGTASKKMRQSWRG